MEQAYRAIDWRAIFLIAGMLPLGTAMQETGAAEYLATQVMDLLGDAGPWPVIMGLYIVTAMATMKRLQHPVVVATALQHVEHVIQHRGTTLEPAVPRRPDDFLLAHAEVLEA